MKQEGRMEEAMTLAEKYEIISRMGYITAGVFLLAAIVLFFVFNIKKIIFDLSGITERHAINMIREKRNSESGKIYSPSGQIRKSRIINELSADSINREKPISSAEYDEKATLNTDSTMVLEYHETTLLEAENTMILKTNETTVLNHSMESDETMILSQNAITEELTGKDASLNQLTDKEMRPVIKNFTILENIIIIHSNVMIDI